MTTLDERPVFPAAMSDELDVNDAVGSGASPNSKTSLAVPVLPSSSVTVSVTVYVPATA